MSATVRLDDGREVDFNSPEGQSWLQAQPPAAQRAIQAQYGNYIKPATPLPTAALSNMAQSYAQKEIGKTALNEVNQAAGTQIGLADLAAAAAVAKGGYDTYRAITGENGGKGARTGLAELGAGAGMFLGGPIGAGIGAVTGSALGWGGKKLGLFHQSTKNAEKERWGALGDMPGAQTAYKAAHDPASDGMWHEGIGAGKEWNWEDAQARAKVNPSEFIGAYGNFDAFGDKWAGTNPAIQNKVVSQLLNENLYDPEKGDITISDKARANQIFDEFAKTQIPATQGAPTTSGSKSSGGGGKKKEKKESGPRLDLAEIAPTYTAPNYQINPSPIYKNPYL